MEKILFGANELERVRLEQEQWANTVLSLFYCLFLALSLNFFAHSFYFFPFPHTTQTLIACIRPTLLICVYFAWRSLRNQLNNSTAFWLVAFKITHKTEKNPLSCCCLFAFGKVKILRRLAQAPICVCMCLCSFCLPWAFDHSACCWRQPFLFFPFLQTHQLTSFGRRL